MIRIDGNIVNQMKKDLNNFEKNKGRYALKKEVQYKKYRDSLTPISKDEFLKRLKMINARYEKYMESCKKYDLKPLDNDKDFHQLLSCVQKAKDGLDYAEIIDKMEAILNDFEIIENDWEIRFSQMQQIKSMITQR